MSLDPCVFKLFTTTSFDENPGSLLCCLRRNSWNDCWTKVVYSYGSRYNYEKCEIAIIDKFVCSMVPKVLHWLDMEYGSCHRFKYRSKLWSCMNGKTEEVHYKSACHEAGHVVCYWFSDNPRLIERATIVPEEGFTGGVHFQNVDPNHVFPNDAVFSHMCCYMGGAVARQLLTHESKTHPSEYGHDLIMLAIFIRLLAKGVMETIDDTGPEVTEALMSFLLQKCFVVSRNILIKHMRELRVVSYALFAEKELDYWDLHEILVPRPQMAKTLFEEFVIDDISSGQFKKEESHSPITIQIRRTENARKNSKCRREEINSEKECTFDFRHFFSSQPDDTISVKESVLDLSSLFTEDKL